MARDDQHAIVLIGMMGSGKSTVAPLLARRLDRPYVDLDVAISERVRQPVASYLREVGEPAFRVTETEVLREVLTSTPHAVIATGGGIVTTSGGRAILCGMPMVIWLRATVDTLTARLQGGNDRPLLDGDRLEQRVRTLLTDRNEQYHEVARFIVDTDGMQPSEITEEIMRTIDLNAATADGVVSVRGIGSDYDIRIAPGSLAHVSHSLNGVRRAMVVTQRNTLSPYATTVQQGLVGAGISCEVITMEDGEHAKRLSTVETLCRQFAERGLLRDDAVIALGGGVVGDVVGFAASVFHRGIAVHQVPTTLLAMVDSSVGGKTGVNLPEGKNLVGAFHQPASVTIDPETLSTLPEREFACGLGEVAKYALMGVSFEEKYHIEAQVREAATAIRARDAKAMAPIIQSCVQLKADIVMEDPKERSGRRALLNYGHTLAHALETATDHALLHGEAVAIGLVFAAELAAELGMLNLDGVDRHHRVVSALGLPTTVPAGLAADDLIALMARDKKSVGGLTFILHHGSELIRVDDPPIAAVRAALERVGVQEVRQSVSETNERYS